MGEHGSARYPHSANDVDKIDTRKILFANVTGLTQLGLNVSPMTGMLLATVVTLSNGSTHFR